MARPGTRGTAPARLATRGRTVTRARAGPRVITGFGRRAMLASDRRADFLADFLTDLFGVFVAADFAFAAFLTRDLAADFLPAALVAFLRDAFVLVFLASFLAPRFAVDLVFLRLGLATIRAAVSALRIERAI